MWKCFVKDFTGFQVKQTEVATMIVVFVVFLFLTNLPHQFGLAKPMNDNSDLTKNIGAVDNAHETL